MAKNRGHDQSHVLSINKKKGALSIPCSMTNSTDNEYFMHIDTGRGGKCFLINTHTCACRKTLIKGAH